MALKEQLFTKMFSKEGTEQSKDDTKPMKPSNILPALKIAIAALVALICIAPLTINIINEGGL